MAIRFRPEISHLLTRFSNVGKITDQISALNKSTSISQYVTQPQDDVKPDKYYCSMHYSR